MGNAVVDAGPLEEELCLAVVKLQAGRGVADDLAGGKFPGDVDCGRREVEGCVSGRGEPFELRGGDEGCG